MSNSSTPAGSTKWSQMVFFVCLHFLLSSAVSAQQRCPDDTYLVMENVCLDKNLSADSVIPLSNKESCPGGYDGIAGTPFCTHDNTALSITGSNYWITGPVPDNCPENFARPPGSRVCVADHLSLALIKGELSLVEPKIDCPDGLEQKALATNCTPINPSEPLESSFSTLACAHGFIKPPGSHFCISFDIAINTSDEQGFGIDAPRGNCPIDWTRAQPGGFCLPALSAIRCGSNTFPCGSNPGDKILFVPEPGNCCTLQGGERQTFSQIPVSSFVQHYPVPTQAAGIDTGYLLKPVIMCGPPGRVINLMCEGVPQDLYGGE